MALKKVILKSGAIKWQARLHVGGGKYVARRFATKQAALDFISNSKQLGADKAAHNFATIASKWLKLYAPTVKPATLINTKTMLRLHILPRFGSKTLEQITLQDYQAAVNDWSEQVPSLTTKLMHYTAAITQYAKANGFALTVSIKDTIKPRQTVKTKNDNFYTREQLQQFLQAVADTNNKKMFALFRLLAFSGLRISEALALKWQDLDTATNTLHVTKTLSRTTNGFTVSTTKTAAGVRSVPLDATTVETLLTYKHSRAKTWGLIFPNENGKIQHGGSATTVWLKRLYSKHSELKQITLHGFRHTHCTLLLEAGTPIQVVKTRLGHSSIQTTLQVYAHATKQQQDKAAELFATYMHD